VVLARLLFLPVVIALTLPSTGLAQSDETEARAQLEQLQREIKGVTRQISADKARKDTLQNQLREAEVALGLLQKDITENRKALQRSRQRLTELTVRQQELTRSRDAQQEQIALELRAAYRMGQPRIKILLNQDDPNTLARVLAYYRYFFQAHNEHIDKYREILAELEELKPAILSLASQLEKAGQHLARQQQDLVQAKRSRERAVTKLLASIAGRGGQLKQLQQDQRELERLLEAIVEAVVNLTMPADYKAFAAAKGSMPWPVSGRASHRFGKSRNAGKMRWQGVTIPAKEGTQVTAIHHGRVVYADWLRGSGLLLIIDHGDGYMSLYAHNQSLLREVGEWVSAGTAISTVGSSGGQDASAVYFEIRYRGKPTNPANWCRR